MPLLIYSAIRLVLFCIALVVLLLLGTGGWLAVVLAAVIGFAVAYLAAPRQRDAAALWLASRSAARRAGGSRLTGSTLDDAAVEDAAAERSALTGGAEDAGDVDNAGRVAGEDPDGATGGQHEPPSPERADGEQAAREPTDPEPPRPERADGEQAAREPTDP